MKRHFFVCLSVLMMMLATSEHAWARRGIPIIWGYGEKFSELGELSPDTAKAVADELGFSVKIALLHSHVHVFWLDLWTWNGRYVLHSGDQYWQPDSAQWQELIGDDPESKFGKPLLYRIPLIPGLLGLAGIGFAVRKRFFKTEAERIEALMNEDRYQQSLEILFERTEGDNTAITTLDERNFQRAKDRLVAEGEDFYAAEINLRRIAEPILAKTNFHIDNSLAVAAQLEQEGDLDRSAEVYTAIIELLPRNDHRLNVAQEGLAAVNSRRNATAQEPAAGGNERPKDWPLP
jgi:hypothetical protein